jgi:hypothetical protein
MKCEKLNIEELAILKELLSANLVEKAFICATNPKESIASVALGAAGALDQEFFLFVANDQDTEKHPDEFFEALAHIVTGQVKGVELEKERAAKNGELIADEGLDEWVKQLESIKSKLPEVKDPEYSDLVLP